MKNHILKLCLLPVFFLFLFGGMSVTAYGKSLKAVKEVAFQDTLAIRNLKRAMQLTDSALSFYFEGEGMKMSRYYNPFTQTPSSEVGSVWMYGSSMEAVIAIMKGLVLLKEHGYKVLYDKYFKYYEDLLKRLYEGADYYLGSFTLTSFTQTKEWTVYAVNRAEKKGEANVTGVLNVYDDQMWLIRNYIEAYKVTKDKNYLHRAEYLSAYVLDGWDACRNKKGEEIGGIPWGPGYVTKHACSNGPLISSLVWLSEFYNGEKDKIIHRYIDKEDGKTRESQSEFKYDYYLSFAEKIYKWEKNHLLEIDKGVYKDMMGGCSPCHPEYVRIDSIKYRTSTPLSEPAGPPISYNNGTMLSGGSSLYQATHQKNYLLDVKKLSDASFRFFAKLGKEVPHHYSYDVSGFNDWFNAVLLEGYMDVLPVYEGVTKYIESFQKNLDFAYTNYLYRGLLPVNLLTGWEADKNKNRVEGMFIFAYAKEYALLSQYELKQ